MKMNDEERIEKKRRIQIEFYIHKNDIMGKMCNW